MNRLPRHRLAAVACAVTTLLCVQTSMSGAPLVPCDARAPCRAGRFCQAGMCQRTPAVGDGTTLFGLGVPPVIAPHGGDDSALAAEVTRRLRRTLAVLGVFRVIEGRSEHIRAGIEAPTPTGYDAQGWYESGAYALLYSALWRTSTGSVVLESRLFEVESGRSVDLRSARQRLDPKHLNSAVERVARALSEHYTGRPGLLGTRIACTRKTPHGKEIVTIDLAGEDERAVTHNGSINLLPSWAPDGRLAFTSYIDGNPDLFFDHQKLSGHPDLNMGAAFSPDGRTIALTLAKDGDAEIYLISPKTGEIILRLTHHPAIDTSPTWSPDGRHLAFVSDRIGAPQIYVMDARGGHVRALTQEGYNTNPCWSPKGGVIVYDRLITAERSDLYEVDVASGEITRLTWNRWSSEDPQFSPDGRMIVFTSNRDGTPQLYVMPASGGHAERLTTGDASYGSPAWSPMLYGR